MKINGKKVIGEHFAYEGCHKMYVCEDQQDIDEVNNSNGYDLVPISELPHVWEISCPLRFISNWKLDKQYVNQFEEAVFEEE